MREMCFGNFFYLERLGEVRYPTPSDQVALDPEACAPPEEAHGLNCPGDSGGPLLNEAGEIFAIAEGGTPIDDPELGVSALSSFSIFGTRHVSQEQHTTERCTLIRYWLERWTTGGSCSQGVAFGTPTPGNICEQNPTWDTWNCVDLAGRAPVEGRPRLGLLRCRGGEPAENGDMRLCPLGCAISAVGQDDCCIASGAGDP